MLSSLPPTSFVGAKASSSSSSSSSSSATSVSITSVSFSSSSSVLFFLLGVTLGLRPPLFFVGVGVFFFFSVGLFFVFVGEGDPIFFFFFGVGVPDAAFFFGVDAGLVPFFFNGVELALLVVLLAPSSALDDVGFFGVVVFRDDDFGVDFFDDDGVVVVCRDDRRVGVAMLFSLFFFVSSSLSLCVFSVSLSRALDLWRTPPRL